jgi:stage II sporulation protein D
VKPGLGRLRSATTGLTVGVVLGPVGLVAAATGASADQTYYVPVTKTWTINGHGYGHGHGMSQYGAQGAALRGRSYRHIVSYYYPGTRFADVKGKVRVLISADSSPDLQVKPHRGLKVRDLRDRSRWRLPVRAGIDRWRMTPAHDGRTAVEFSNRSGWHRWHPPDGRRTLRGDGEFSAHGALTLLVPGGSDVVGKRYRGALRLARPYPGAATRDTVNVLAMDQYVQGVVPYEMPGSWKQQALRSQAVAARTYATWQRAQNPSRYYQICDTTACQVYGGVAAEQSTTNRAVQATARRILTFHGKPAFTQFSASSGGWTAAGGAPYLPAKKDRYDASPGNSVHDWSVKVNATSLERLHPEIGRLIDVRVTRRDGHGAWNGRVVGAVLEGTSGNARMTGDDLRWHFGLRSTWFSIEPTPITARWRHLGGTKSVIGKPVSGEFPVLSGSAQKFSGGRIYWAPQTGARELSGPILTAYRRWGGPASNLGWPQRGVLAAPGRGHKTQLMHGAIYSLPRTGAHVLYGHVWARWSKAGSARSGLGYPTTDVFSVKEGRRARFQHGVITWDRSSDTFHIRRF